MAITVHITSSTTVITRYFLLSRAPRLQTSSAWLGSAPVIWPHDLAEHHGAIWELRVALHEHRVVAADERVVAHHLARQEDGFYQSRFDEQETLQDLLRVATKISPFSGDSEKDYLPKARSQEEIKLLSRFHHNTRLANSTPILIKQRFCHFGIGHMHQFSKQARDKEETIKMTILRRKGWRGDLFFGTSVSTVGGLVEQQCCSNSQFDPLLQIITDQDSIEPCITNKDKQDTSWDHIDTLYLHSRLKMVVAPNKRVHGDTACLGG